ncbi:DUF5658 family protein [Haloarcula litorea]|uniref:DUF5658 family protein n=1 Tax=Haloarcula litorea TaxID=3032579 RepID=UPI0023E84EBB|nr:DUF5658 family protein [Halomicroarcula sp. GDY20]
MNHRLDLEHLLWGGVLGASGADIALTLVGLSLCFAEANPVARTAIDLAGGGGLVALKTGALGLLFLLCRRVGRRYRLAALSAFLLPQAVAAGHNGVLLLRHAPAC